MKNCDFFTNVKELIFSQNCNLVWIVLDKLSLCVPWVITLNSAIFSREVEDSLGKRIQKLLEQK